MKTDLVYLRLFHGRNKIDDDMNDWGFDGPIVGPIGFSWTYGMFKIHEPSNAGFAELDQHEDLIYLRDKDGTDRYFGDFEIFNPSYVGSLEGSHKILSYDEFLTEYPNVK